MIASPVQGLPLDVTIRGDVEHRPDRPQPYRARVRWMDPATRQRRSKSEAFDTAAAAQSWIEQVQRLATSGIDPLTATRTLADYGDTVMPLALRGLEATTHDVYLVGRKYRVVPTLGHLSVRMVTNGAVDRAVQQWIADERSRSTVRR
nr:hypothetical protein [Pseudonocardia sp. AL041005-10]